MNAIIIPIIQPRMDAEIVKRIESGMTDETDAEIVKAKFEDYTRLLTQQRKQP